MNDAFPINSLNNYNGGKKKGYKYQALNNKTNQSVEEVTDNKNWGFARIF